jgi:hypothetical protein
MNFNEIEDYIILHIDSKNEDKKKLSIKKGETISNIRKEIYKLFSLKGEYELYINNSFHLNKFYDPLEIKSFYPILQKKIITVSKSKRIYNRGSFPYSSVNHYYKKIKENQSKIEFFSQEKFLILEELKKKEKSIESTIIKKNQIMPEGKEKKHLENVFYIFM